MEKELKMLEVVCVEKDPECALDGQQIALVENGYNYKVTATGETQEDRIIYESDEVGTGFVQCGDGVLNGKSVKVYYIVDMDNTDVADKLFIVEEDKQTNSEIYKKWCRHQEDAGLPKPAYSVEAYAQSTIDMWKRILDNN